MLSKVITDVAARNPAFAQQLQTIAQQAGVQGSGVQGSANVSGDSRVYGNVTGVNTAPISGTYTIGEDRDKS